MFQTPIFALNVFAFLNIYSICLALLTSQPPISWLNASAPLNMLSNCSTLDVFHPLISKLNVALSLNNIDISVTKDVSYFVNLPYFASAAAASWKCSATAAFNPSLSN